MSRAFTKEPDGNEIEDLPEIPVSTHRNLVTENGHKLIKEQIAKFEKTLKEAQAKEDKPVIAQAQRNLRYWNARLATAEMVPAQANNDKVLFGHKVTIELDSGRKRVYRIVGQDEADPSADLLSYVSPLANSMIGKVVGEIIQMGDNEAEISQIEV